MKLRKHGAWMVIAVAAGALTACGGGGGDPGTPSGGSGSGGSDGGSSSEFEAKFSVSIRDLNTGATVTRITTAETARVLATLTRSDGGDVSNQVVTFSESGAGLLKFSPTSMTALTDADGTASIEVAAASSSSAGATSIAVNATVNGQSATGSTNLAISSNPAVDPQTLVQSLLYSGSNPSDRSIVIAGSGGSGRSESAQLQFKAADQNGAAVAGATVQFQLNTSLPTGQAPRLLTTSAVTNSEGIATASVLSGTAATSVIVRAEINNGINTVSTQSDVVTVTTGLATQAGFDLAASKHTLDDSLSGDTSTITVRAVDANGNPVADGVAIVATSDKGRVGTADRGGCVTTDGACTVDYLVQEPRPADGEDVNVLFSARLGDGTEISKVLPLRQSRIENVGLWSTAGVANLGSRITTLTPGDADECAFTTQAYIGTPGGSSLPAGSTAAFVSHTTGLSASFSSGLPVASDAFYRQLVDIKVTGRKKTEQVAAVTGGTITLSATLNGKTVSPVRLTVSGIPGCE
ncbi:hypothetical protein [Corticibacter populi]|nr:hypothetical protein [Corticibacter populi]